jgi:sporulation protein YlmC with PRC-barrel domain
MTSGGKEMTKQLIMSVLVCSLLLLTSEKVRSENDDKSAGGSSVEAHRIQLGAWRASQLMGISVHSQDGNRVGSIADMVGDVKGKVIYVVLSHGGFLGIGDKLIPLPWDAIKPGEQAGTLVVNLSKEALIKAPNFDSKKWPDFNQSEWNEKTKKYYHGSRRN